MNPQPKDNIFESVELTVEELESAIYEAKKKKWFHLQHEAYWQKQESAKGKTKVTEIIKA
jgi:hypothetical protein